MLYRIMGEIDGMLTAGCLTGRHIEFSNKAAQALVRVRRLNAQGYVNVQAIDTATGKLCDVTCLRRSAEAEHR